LFVAVPDEKPLHTFPGTALRARPFCCRRLFKKNAATSPRNFGEVELFAAPPGRIFPLPAFLAQRGAAARQIPPGRFFRRPGKSMFKQN
jgi:hypothetical protein